MLHELKLYWLEKSTFTRVLTEPTYDASIFPPVIALSLRSDEVVNTEAEKKSVYLSSQVDGRPVGFWGFVRGVPTNPPKFLKSAF